MESTTGEAYAAADPDPVQPHAARRHRPSQRRPRRRARRDGASARRLPGHHRGDVHGRRPLRPGSEGHHRPRRRLHPDRLRRADRLDRRIAFGHRRADAPARSRQAAEIRSPICLLRPDARTPGKRRSTSSAPAATNTAPNRSGWPAASSATTTSTASTPSTPGSGSTVVSRAVADLAAMNGIEFDAVGGLTMGADPLAHRRRDGDRQGLVLGAQGAEAAWPRAVDRGHPHCGRHPGAARRRRDQHRRLHRDRLRPRDRGRRGRHRSDPDGGPRRTRPNASRSATSRSSRWSPTATSASSRSKTSEPGPSANP